MSYCLRLTQKLFCKMPEELVFRIKVTDILKSQFAVSTEEGESLFNLINSHLTTNGNVELDFRNVELIVSTFLNAAIGQLYGHHSTEFIQSHLSLINMTNDDLNILKKVTDRAKDYFKNKDHFEKILKKHLPDAE
jgi:hypothetical protein